MEPERPDLSPTEPAARNDLRALTRLRDRVEAAAREIERLRDENMALAARVSALQAEAMLGGDGIPAFAGLQGEDAEALKARIQGFIDTIDRLLNTSESAARSPDA